MRIRMVVKVTSTAAIRWRWWAAGSLAWAIEDALHLLGLTQHTLWSVCFYGVLGGVFALMAWASDDLLKEDLRERKVRIRFTQEGERE